MSSHSSTAESPDPSLPRSERDNHGFGVRLGSHGGRLATVPLLEGQVFLQVALVFSLIGALGLILKWTFSRGKDAPSWPAETPTHAPLPNSPAVSAKPWSATDPPATDLPAIDASTSGPHTTAPAVPSVQPEDYGLLASVAALDSAAEAARVRSLLANAGIRATTTVGADGRHRVLVFSAELHRARRVAGGA
jgi:hypothetical protein